MLEVAIVIQEEPPRPGWFVYMVSNRLVPGGGLVYDLLGDARTKGEAEDAAGLWREAFRAVKGIGPTELKQLKVTDKAECATHVGGVAVRPATQCDQFPMVEGKPDKNAAADAPPPMIPDPDAKPCELHETFYVVPTELK